MQWYCAPLEVATTGTWEQFSLQQNMPQHSTLCRSPLPRCCRHHSTQQRRTPNHGYRTAIQQGTPPMDRIQEPHRCWQKKIIQDGIGVMYLKGTTDRNVGLADFTIREILDFLFKNYRNITQYDIEENDKKLKEKWDANTPLEMLFDQIDDAQDFAAAARKHYMNNQLLTTAYNLVYATGLFFDVCKAWNRLPTNQKTMVNFKTTFQQAQRELRDQQRTAQQAGFHANGIWCQPTKTHAHPLQETAEALANLATATASDRQVLQNLTNTVKELCNQIKAKDRQIEDLIKALNSNKTMGDNTRSTRWEKKDCGSYCHTHGYKSQLCNLQTTRPQP